MLKDLSKFRIGYINSEKILLYTLSIFPLTFLIGNSVINFFIIIKIKFNFQNKIFLIMLLFWFSLIVNLFFSQNPSLGIPRVIKFFFIILFVSSIKLIISNKDKWFENNIFKMWSIIFCVVVVDLIYEFYFGFNTLGFVSYMPGRLASFLNDELTIGYFFSGFAVMFLAYTYNKKHNTVYILLLCSLLIFVSFVIGERSNFLKFFLAITIFIFVILEYSLKKKIASIFITLIIISGFLSTDINYKTRYIKQIPNIFEKNSIQNFLKNSVYGSHYNTAYKIFKIYPIFGVGIKNYREESGKKIYMDKEYKFFVFGTHPHQIHFEFLSETGLFGYVSFLLFMTYSLFLSIKSFIKYRNNYQFAALTFILVSLLPLLPSGSFFSTYSSALFWLNYGIMIAYIKK